MKQLLVGLGLVALSTTASADFFNNNGGEWKMGPYGPYYEESNWPEWTPMYWMDEMMNSFDDNNNTNGNGFNFGNMPFMGNNNNYPVMPYGAAPMGYGMPQAMPYGAQPPMMPYGAAPAPMPTAPAAGMPGPSTPTAPTPPAQ